MLEAEINLSRGQIEKTLKILEIEGVVGHERGHYFRTTNPFEVDLERVERVTALRREELEEMRAYVDHPGCLMEYIVRALDDPAAARCGHCRNDGGAVISAAIDPALLVEATKYLRRTALPIPPRRRWPPDAVTGLRGTIVPCNMPGMALSIYGDAGWGHLVREGKYIYGAFDDALVDAAVELVSREWTQNPAPTWVTSIPSSSRPALVRDFAISLAARLALPYRDVLGSASGPSQKEMENSVQQLRNVRAKVSLVGEVPTEAVLLVDDIVDSGWTLAYAGWLLGRAGAIAVYPFALAGGSRGDA